MKIDLEDLERCAKDPALQLGCGPQVTLGLVARIRELESLADMVIDKYEDALDLITDEERSDCDRWRGIVEKGAVIS